ncbi:uncharacterized protein FFNC_15574 [Fusarium fujikuroi]|nr:uncharacterized protein FFNC_15574 [Fusarium fujikuroi]
MSTEPAGDGAADENSPLLNGGASPAPPDAIQNGNGYGLYYGRINLSRGLSAMAFFFSSSIARSWHSRLRSGIKRPCTGSLDQPDGKVLECGHIWQGRSLHSQATPLVAWHQRNPVRRGYKSPISRL